MTNKFEIEIADQNVVVSAYRKPGGTDELFERIAKEARSHVPDVTTKKGRDQIGSLAMKISKSKVFIEKCGKELVAAQKAEIKAIDDDRIATVRKFDELRNEILAPREAWEQTEKDRIAGHEEAIKNIKSAAYHYIDTPAENLKQSLQWLENLVIDAAYEEYEDRAKLARYEAIELLKKNIVAREKYEAEQAELERQRIAEQERLRREHEERIAREAEERATRQAEEAARREAERFENEKRQAAEREAKLKAEKEAAELRAQQAAENERKRIEQERLAQEEAHRIAEEKRLANKAHKKRIFNEAMQALINLGFDEATSKNILLAIHNGKVPHVSINY